MTYAGAGPVPSMYNQLLQQYGFGGASPSMGMSFMPPMMPNMQMRPGGGFQGAPQGRAEMERPSPRGEGRATGRANAPGQQGRGPGGMMLGGMFPNFPQFPMMPWGNPGMQMGQVPGYQSPPTSTMQPYPMPFGGMG